MVRVNFVFALKKLKGQLIKIAQLLEVSSQIALLSNFECHLKDFLPNYSIQCSQLLGSPFQSRCWDLGRVLISFNPINHLMDLKLHMCLMSELFHLVLMYEIIFQFWSFFQRVFQFKKYFKTLTKRLLIKPTTLLVTLLLSFDYLN